MNRRYLLRRVLQFVPTTAAILLAGFLLAHLAPGDPVLALAGENGDAEYYALMRAKFGLDEPLAQQLLTYVSNLARGDFGISYVHGRPVLDIILERLPATLLLTTVALVLSSLAGVALGAFTATRRRRWSQLSVTTTMLVLYAAPIFLVAQVAILLLALGTGWFPIQGFDSAAGPRTGVAHLLDVAHHLALPALVLASQEVAVVCRLTSVGLRDELVSDHVRTARSKGLPERVVVARHALRGVLAPVFTVIGGRVGHLVAGAVVVESIFGWPGMGQLLVEAMRNRDSPIVLGVFVLIALAVVIANLLTDLVYSWLDPRVTSR
ncbi:MAG: ABC transporter permease [Actinomycetota bacterium]|nr:ABC transporter permease [Actinomycetota bacterium]